MSRGVLDELVRSVRRMGHEGEMKREAEWLQSETQAYEDSKESPRYSLLGCFGQSHFRIKP